MITKSIERAQRKVEENNFGTRKRLLEYDDVMNSQREVIYKRRRNALYGERLELDVMNMVYDTCEEIVLNNRAAENYDSFKLNGLSILGIDSKISQEEFMGGDEIDVVERLYNEAFDHYKEKNERLSKTAFPIIKHTFEERGATFENIQVPITDGKRQIGVVTNLKDNVESGCKELPKSMEKIITLALIDQNWKDHLRQMDDLKQSVQNAVYEQKDPLLIYKFEAFELFKRFVAKVNEETVSFLQKADLPKQQPDQLREAQSRRERQKLNESKAEVQSSLSGRSAQAPNRPPVEKVAPVKSLKVAGRNDRVSVQYQDGSVKKGVKFKTVEEDIKNNRCVLIEE